MPFVKLSQEGVTVRRRRLLINGAPNTRKTTSLLTLPGPRAIVSSPGEKGYDTLPLNDSQTLPFIWNIEDNKKDSHAIVREVIQTSMDCITGKHGKLISFAFEGVHKFFEYIMDSVTDGAWFKGEDFEPKAYALGYRMLEDFLSRLIHNTLPVVAFTCWAEPEADRKPRPGEKSRDIPNHMMPALPGQAAQKIMGEFSVIVHASVGPIPPGTEAVGRWQTKPYGEVWGCSIKAPAEVVKKIPVFIPADYTVLDKLLTNGLLTNGGINA